MEQKLHGAYYTGTSGLLLPVPNKEFYPPEYRDKSRLHYYASLYNSIEINSSFYKMPRRQTLEKWTADVPEKFKFTFKLLKDITHSKNLDFDPSLVGQFMSNLSGTGQKKGCLLVQFPSSVKSTQQRQVQHLLHLLIAADPQREWKIAVEFRDPSWYTSATYEILSAMGTALVTHDKFKSGVVLEQTDVPFSYLRFHGPDGNYRGKYEDDVLSGYQEIIQDWQSQGKAVYVYFNNTMGDAIANMVRLRKGIENG